MTSKEKAKELVEKIRLKMPPTIIPTASTRTNQLSCDIDLKGGTKNAIQCSLIAVDEILLTCQGIKKLYEDNGMINSDIDWQAEEYWQEVKQELEKL